MKDDSAHVKWKLICALRVRRTFYWLSSRSLIIILWKSSSVPTRIFSSDFCWAINLTRLIIFDTKLDNSAIECDHMVFIFLTFTVWIVGKFPWSFIFVFDSMAIWCSFWALTYLFWESMQQKWPVNIFTFSRPTTEMFGLLRFTRLP